MPLVGNHWLKKSLLIAALLTLACGAASINAASAHDAYPLTKAQVEQAAHAGDADAEYAWGYMLYYGKDGVTPNKTEAMTWFHKAAAKGQPQAVQALEIFRRAAQPLKAEAAQAKAAKTPVHDHEQAVDKAPAMNLMAHADDVVPAGHSNPMPKAHDEHPTKVDMSHRVIVPAKGHVQVSHSAIHHVPVHAQPKPAMTPHPVRVPAHQDHHAAMTHDAPAVKHVTAPSAKVKMMIPSKMFDQLLARNHKVLMHRSSDAFSIQLVASHHFDKLLEFARTKDQLMHIPSLHPLIFYRTMRGHQPWYVLLGGSYKDHAQAKHVLGLLGHQLSPIKPFIKSMHAVKSEMAHG